MESESEIVFCIKFDKWAPVMKHLQPLAPSVQIFMHMSSRTELGGTTHLHKTKITHVQTCLKGSGCKSLCWTILYWVAFTGAFRNCKHFEARLLLFALCFSPWDIYDTVSITIYNEILTLPLGINCIRYNENGGRRQGMCGWLESPLHRFSHLPHLGGWVVTYRPLIGYFSHLGGMPWEEWLWSCSITWERGFLPLCSSHLPFHLSSYSGQAMGP